MRSRFRVRGERKVASESLVQMPEPRAGKQFDACFNAAGVQGRDSLLLLASTSPGVFVIPQG
jgi:hypothetical protein